MGVWRSHPLAQASGSFLTGATGKAAAMDAIRKKMQSLKSETDGLYNTIAGFEEATREAAARADQAECDIRDYGKKVQQLEIGFDETNDKLTKATESLEEAEKQFKEVESDVSALTKDHAHGGGGQKVRRAAVPDHHQACPHLQGCRQCQRPSRLLRTLASTTRSPLRSWT